MQDVTVTVIGAGISGSLAALKSAQKYKILTLEAGKTVLPEASSSHNECYKLHTGAHFIGDIATAKHCLSRSVAFAREFPDFLAGSDLLSPWRRGRHYIMSNSLVSVERAREVVLELQADYAQLVAEDEKNKVFGEPENFIKFLSKEDYPYLAETIPFYDSDNTKTEAHVALGIETAESQIDIDKLQGYVQQQIEEHSNITFMPSQEVTHIARDPSALGYLVTTKNAEGKKQTFKTRTIVNCAWQNIEILNKTLGLSMPDDERVVRIKVSVLVELSASLRNINTCIFSSGPYASITVLPNGTAVLTSERWTNAGSFKAGIAMPGPISELLDNMTLNTAVGQHVAQQIVLDCASYLSEEARAEFQTLPIKELRVGFVKIKGPYTQQSIYQANSCVHSRLEDGVEEFEAGFIANGAMKMTYAASNATIVSEMLDRHLAILNKMDELIVRIKERLYFNCPYLQPLSAVVDLMVFLSCRSLIEEKVSSLAYERDAEKCIKELVKIIFIKISSFVMRRCDDFFVGLYTSLHDLVGAQIASLVLKQDHERSLRDFATEPPQKAQKIGLFFLCSSLRYRSFFSEAPLLNPTSKDFVDESPLTGKRF